MFRWGTRKSVVEPSAGTAEDIGSARPASALGGVAKRAAGLIAVLSIAAAIVWRILGPAGLSRDDAAVVGPMHRQVTFAGKDGLPSLSPDGRRLAYVSTGKTEKSLMVQELPEGRPLAVFAAPEIGHVRWSPDGSELHDVDARRRTRRHLRHDSELEEPSAGSRPANTSRAGHPTAPRLPWRPTRGGKIVFLNRLGQQGTSRLASGSAFVDTGPRLVRSRRTADVCDQRHERRFTVWTIRPDGSEQKKVLTENTEISSARWAPRGEAIYFSRRLNQTFSFYRIPVQGGDNRNAVAATLITGLEAESSFALSADGTRLAYARALVPFQSLDARRRRRRRIAAGN